MDTTMSGRDGTIPRTSRLEPRTSTGSISFKNLVLNVLAEKTEDGISRAEQLIRDVVDLARKGRATCLKFLREYVEDEDIEDILMEVYAKAAAIDNGLITDSPVSPPLKKGEVPLPDPESKPHPTPRSPTAIFRRDKKKPKQA